MLIDQYRSPKKSISPGDELHESPYTIPNALTIARIIACPFLGYHIIHGNFGLATGILLAGGISDAVSGLDQSLANVLSLPHSWTAGSLESGM